MRALPVLLLTPFALAVTAAPASAIVGEWQTTEAGIWEGVGCAAQDTEVLDEFAPGAYALKPRTPRVGSKIKDDDGNVVATITALTPNARSERKRTITYTATGSDSVCTGAPNRPWETEAVNLVVDYKTDEPPMVMTDCFVGPRYKPTVIWVSCANDFGKVILRRMRWRAWTDRAARGRGIARVKVGKRRRSYRVNIRLYAPRLCQDSGEFQFKRLRWTFPSRKPPNLPRTKIVRHSCGDNGEDTGDEL